MAYMKVSKNPGKSNAEKLLFPFRDEGNQTPLIRRSNLSHKPIKLYLFKVIKCVFYRSFDTLLDIDVEPK